MKKFLKIGIRQFNYDAAARIILLLGYSAFFLYAVISGYAGMYVHPRINPFLILAAAVMTAAALLMLKSLLKPVKFSVKTVSLVLFAVPLIMAFTLPAKSLSPSSGTFYKGTVRAESSDETEDQTSAEDSIPESETEDSVIEMNNDNFYKWIDKIYSDPDGYIGRTVTVTGFVYRENGFDGDVFVPARMMMVCCAADMVVVGFYCKYDGTSSLADNCWVTVTGTIAMIYDEEEGGFVPGIEAVIVESAEKPEKEYVYP